MKITKQDGKVLIYGNGSLILQNNDKAAITVEGDDKPFVYVQGFHIKGYENTFQSKLKTLWFVYKYLFK